MKRSLLFLLSCAQLMVYAQTTTFISTLSNAISETSGLIYYNDTLITHNDSDHLPELYAFDGSTGLVNRTISIANASNIDWEDLAIDQDYIYIGDFGNNQGTRTDLKIYRVALTDYLNTANDTIMAEHINFHYADQVDFTPNTFYTPYDAEAFICFRDSLFIFTKNWSNSTTQIYAIPKTPGNHTAVKQDSMNTGFLVTGADYDTLNQTIALIGYGFNSAMLLEISNISAKISDGNLNAFALNCAESYQIEGVTFGVNNCVYISAEQHSSGAATLYEYFLPNVSLEENVTIPALIYPNPVSNVLNININSNEYYTVYSGTGKFIISSSKTELEVSNLKNGIYFIVIFSPEFGNRTFRFIKN